MRLYDASGKILGARQVLTGGGYNAQSATPVHFGLASLAPVTVEVRFMAQGGAKVQTRRSVRPRDYAGKSLIIKEDR
ncbi:MAG: ASPIC/UnbV domain-containing protein [Hyphomonadaceae bacterium]|nr:ASPIC/UnbV domain-containing protein [Hyphomonadaceae bacterium]